MSEPKESFNVPFDTEADARAALDRFQEAVHQARIDCGLVCASVSGRAEYRANGKTLGLDKCVSLGDLGKLEGLILGAVRSLWRHMDKAKGK